MMMLCRVYKSMKQADYYLYVEMNEDLDRVPESLVELLGDLEKIVEFDLDKKSHLAQADISQVKDQITDCGYYLQMPSTEPHPLDA